MQNLNIAILLTCHNRKDKTIACLASLHGADVPTGIQYDVYLTDDGSSDGTRPEVERLFPEVKIIRGNGNLFWAGGMRLAWKSAMANHDYDAYLLINDDVLLDPSFFSSLLKTEEYSIEKTGQRGIYSGAMIDSASGKVTYGASVIRQNHLVLATQKLSPGDIPERCDLVNANVLWVSATVVEQIGIFDERFTHGIADYDYSRRAAKKNIPLWLAPNICGTCEHDHGHNWLSGRLPLKKRIAWMKSPKGLAYSEYLYYVRTHFPFYLPYSFMLLWLKIFFPFVWDWFKK